MGDKLLLVPWFAGVVYSSIPLFWFAIHPFAARWRRMRRSPYRVLLPAWLGIIAALGWGAWPWRSQQIYSTPWMSLPAFALFVFGLSAYRRIFSEFGGNKLSGEAELRPAEHDQELVTTGLHARMRHPIYVAHLANLAGWTLGSGLVVNFVLLAVSVLVTFPLMVFVEERELEQRFGESFRAYKARVPLVSLFNHHSPVMRHGREV